MKRLFLLLAVLLPGAQAAAWDDHGHMLVAAVAYDRLTPQARGRAAALLALNQWPVNGYDDAAPGDEAKARFMMAATAPDAVKNPRYGLTDDGDDARRAPEARRNIGFSDPDMHKYWHYIDLPFSPDDTPTISPPAVNVQEPIALFRKVIASSAPDALKAYDLVWLLHLVGDIHQPLHATTRFTADAPRGDAGGNSVRLCDVSCRHNLHSFWDDVLGGSEHVALIMKAARALPEADPELATVGSEAIWAQESFQLAQDDAYAFPITPSLGPFTLDDTYRANARQVAEQRVALAGVRLANLLNAELK